MRCARASTAPGRRPSASLILYVHGGGWTFGSIDTHDGTMRNLAAAAQLPVLGIDYRLAPEHPFPAPLDDVLTAHRLRRIRRPRRSRCQRSPSRSPAIRPEQISPSLRSSHGATRGSRHSHRRHSSMAATRRISTTAEPRGIRRRRLSPHHREHALVLDQLPGTGGQPTRPRSRSPCETDLARLAAALPVRGRSRSAARRYVWRSPSCWPTPAVPFRCDHVPGVVHGCLRMTRELDAARRNDRVRGPTSSSRNSTKKTWEEHNHGTPRIPEAHRRRRAGGAAGTARHRPDADDRALVVSFRQSAELAGGARREVRAGESRHQDPGRGDSVGRRQRLPDPPVRRSRRRQRPGLPPWCACPGPRASQR